jgi:hypothetical protein
MTIPNVSDERLKEILSENLTPSDTIKTPDRLFGREKMLQRIDRAFSSPGRQIFIYGDRGVGKTSVALTSAFLHTGIENVPSNCLTGIRTPVRASSVPSIRERRSAALQGITTIKSVSFPVSVLNS